MMMSLDGIQLIWQCPMDRISQIMISFGGIKLVSNYI